MNWFTWVVVVVGVVLTTWVLVSALRPRRPTVDESRQRREGDMGEAHYRGGLAGRPFDGNVSGP